MWGGCVILEVSMWGEKVYFILAIKEKKSVYYWKKMEIFSYIMWKNIYVDREKVLIGTGKKEEEEKKEEKRHFEKSQLMTSCKSKKNAYLRVWYLIFNLKIISQKI